MKITVLIDFSKFTDSGLVTESENIIRQFTGNANFSDPDHLLEAVVSAKGAYIPALTASIGGGAKAVNLKNEKRQALEEALRLLGLYIQANCNNNANLVLGTGYKIKKGKSTIGMLEKPKNFTVMPGPNSGSLKLKVDAIHGADVYIFQYSLTPVTGETIWMTKVSGKSSLIIDELIPGKEYAFRVAGKGSSDDEVYSDVITHFVA